jgi:hypothetical protein
MFIFLSSGARERYRQDVLRAIAQPKNTILQFPYERYLLAPGIASRLTNVSKLVGLSCLITYLDRSDRNKPPELVPCRMATLAAVVPHGNTVSVQLELGTFARAHDPAKFTSEMRKIPGATVPDWVEGRPHPKGHFWFEVPRSDGSQQGQSEEEALWTKIEEGLERSDDLAVWEKIVAQLASRTDFQKEPYFFSFRGLHRLGRYRLASGALATQELRPDATGCYELVSDVDYEVQLYHLLPKDAKPELGTFLEVGSGSSLIEFTTNPKLPIDSGYDLKRIRFKAGRPTRTLSTFLSVFGSSERVETIVQWFDIPVVVPLKWWKTIGIGLLVGLPLAMPMILSTWLNDKLSVELQFVVSVVAMVAAGTTGVLAAFNFSRLE